MSDNIDQLLARLEKQSKSQNRKAWLAVAAGVIVMIICTQLLFWISVGMLRAALHLH